MDRLLLVTQNWLGDALFATPAVRAIRKRYPRSHIACLVTGRVKPVLINNPNVDELIVYNDRASVFSFSFWKTILLLKKKRFDAAIFFHASATKVRLTRWAGIRQRWGYSTARRKKILTRSIEIPAGPMHRIDYFLNLVRSLEISSDGRLMDFYPEPAAGAVLDNLLKKSGTSRSQPYIVVHAGGNWSLKRWPSEYFSQLIYFFVEKFHWKVFLCGSRGEEAIALRIVSKLKHPDVVSLCGKTTLDMLALLLKNAKLFVSNDSGPIHLGASQNTPILALFGPTSPEETGPVSGAPLKILRKDVGCTLPCYFKSCNYRVCMDFLLPAEVFTEAQEILKQP